VTWCSLHVRVQITELSGALIFRVQETDILKLAAAYFARTLLDKPPIIWRHITEGRKINYISIIVQRDATQSSLFINPRVHSTCFGCQSHPSSGVHKTVTTVSGTGHIFCAATSLQSGQLDHVGGR